MITRWNGEVTEVQQLTHPAFHYSVDDSSDAWYTPPLGADPGDCTWWVVRIRGKSYIPANLLVLATSGEAAIERVMNGLRTCAERDYRGSRGCPDHYQVRCVNRALHLLEDIASGALWIEVATHNPRLVCQVPWVNNIYLTRSAIARDQELEKPF